MFLGALLGAVLQAHGRADEGVELPGLEAGDVLATLELVDDVEHGALVGTPGDAERAREAHVPRVRTRGGELVRGVPVRAEAAERRGCVGKVVANVRVGATDVHRRRGLVGDGESRLALGGLVRGRAEGARGGVHGDPRPASAHGVTIAERRGRAPDDEAPKGDNLAPRKCPGAPRGAGSSSARERSQKITPRRDDDGPFGKRHHPSSWYQELRSKCSPTACVLGLLRGAPPTPLPPPLARRFERLPRRGDVGEERR